MYSDKVINRKHLTTKELPIWVKEEQKETII